jgi:hypothetical protein
MREQVAWLLDVLGLQRAATPEGERAHARLDALRTHCRHDLSRRPEPARPQLHSRRRRARIGGHVLKEGSWQLEWPWTKQDMAQPPITCVSPLLPHAAEAHEQAERRAGAAVEAAEGEAGAGEASTD